MATVFVDESGNTGSDLLSAEQPIIVVGSHDFSEDESKQLRAAHFAADRAPSLKFSRMKERPQGQKAILSFMEAVKPQQIRTALYAAHKPFALICKVVDLVIEPSMHHQGENLYERGGNIAFANLLSMMLNSIATPAYRARVMAAFHDLFREPNHVSIAELARLLDEKTGLTRGKPKADPLAETLSFVHVALWDLDKRKGFEVDKGDLAFYRAAVLVVMAEWGIRHGGNIDLIHDQSTKMASQLGEWEKVVSTDAPPAIVGMDRRTMKFPIGVKSTRFEPDQNWAGLQLADILAGATRTALEILWNTRDAKNEFEEKLVEVLTGWTLIDRMVADARTTPEELGTDGPAYADPFKYYHNLLAKG